MSRIGRKPIVIPAGVEVTIKDNVVTVKGPKGTLNSKIHPMMIVKIEGGEVLVTRTNISNMVEGVVNGFEKKLEVQGVGYRVAKQGKSLVMNLGFSHQVIVDETDEIKIEAPDANTIIIKGIDKQKVGQFAAEVREKRPPEPYKGKGIRYAGEHIIRKEGKAGKGK